MLRCLACALLYLLAREKAMLGIIVNRGGRRPSTPFHLINTARITHLIKISDWHSWALTRPVNQMLELPRRRAIRRLCSTTPWAGCEGTGTLIRLHRSSSSSSMSVQQIMNTALPALRGRRAIPGSLQQLVLRALHHLELRYRARLPDGKALWGLWKLTSLGMRSECALDYSPGWG